MTSLCVASGPSQAKPGFGLTVDMTAAALAARFANTAGWLSVFVAATIAGAHYELSSFCGTDPPAEPAIVAQDIVDAIQIGDWAAKFAAQKKLQDWFGAHIWFDLCECVSGAQPTPITYQTNPGNLPQIDPPSVVPPVATTPCVHEASSNVTWGPGSGNVFGGITDLKHLNPTSFQVTTVNSVFSGTGPGESITFQQFAQDGTTVLRTDTWAITHSQTIVRTIPAIVGVFFMKYTTTWNATTGLTLSQTTVDTYCNGAAPGGSVTPCCPPDPVATGLLQQILDMVTLIQRQSVPFGYVTGTAHTGLSGAGVLSISGIMGIKVDVTTLPSSYGTAGAEPPEYFGLGFLTFGTPDGYPTAVRLERQHQLSLPSRCGAYTELAYDLGPGVVIDITEVLKEPS